MNKTFLIYLSIFIFFFGIFYYLQFSFPGLQGADPFYHIKESWLVRAQGITETVKSFPWLQHHLLKDLPGDPWFGYHLLLLPFTFGNLILGAKWSAVFLASLIFFSFFLVLKKFKVSYPFFWTIFLFLSSASFDFRLLLSRPHLLALLLFPWLIYSIASKKYLLLGLVSFIYSFSVLVAPLVLAMPLLWLILEFVKTRKLDLKLLIFPLTGFIAGFLVRPDFPHNLYLVYKGTIEILLLRVSGVNLNFGVELLYPFSGMVKDNILLFLATVLPFAYIVVSSLQRQWQEKVPLLTIYLFSVVALFAGFTLFQSNRFIEYWVPSAILASALIFERVILPAILKIIKGIKVYQNYHYRFFITGKILSLYQKIYRALRATFLFLEKKSIKAIFTFTFFFLVFYLLFYQSFQLSQLAIRSGVIDERTEALYQEAAQWLKDNSTQGSLVLNKPWSTFPRLFFYNHYNYYAFGMDPAFGYFKNPSSYWLWRNIMEKLTVCDKEVCPGEKQKAGADEIYRILKGRLKGDFIFIDGPPSEEFQEIMTSSDKFEEVFKKGIVTIYKIK